MKKIQIDPATQRRPTSRKQNRSARIKEQLTQQVEVQVIPAKADMEGYERPKPRVCAYCRVSTDMDTQAYRKKNNGQAPMYYVEGTHPAIIDKEMFDMVQNEMERRKETKEQAVGNGKYSSKYPFSGVLVCGECGHKLRRHVRRVGSGKTVPAWGCCNRITNGRDVCDSHHVNEETLQRTYLAAISDMIEDAEEIMAAVRESAGLVMQPENAEVLNRIEQEIIEVQEAVLALHKAKQNCSVSATDYATQIQAYSQRMQELEAQQEEQKSIATRYAEVKAWLDAFEKHIRDGSIMDADDSAILKQLVEQIIVGTSGIEIQFKCGVSVEKDYE